MARDLHTALQPKDAGLVYTSEPAKRKDAGAFLLYLRDERVFEVRELELEVLTALTDGQPVLLVHERRDSKGAVIFDKIIQGTPATLLSAGIYDAIAVPLYAGAHHRVSMHALADKLRRITPTKHTRPGAHLRWLSSFYKWARSMRQISAIHDTSAHLEIMDISV